MAAEFFCVLRGAGPLRLTDAFSGRCAAQVDCDCRSEVRRKRVDAFSRGGTVRASRGCTLLAAAARLGPTVAAIAVQPQLRLTVAAIARGAVQPRLRPTAAAAFHGLVDVAKPTSP